MTIPPLPPAWQGQLAGPKEDKPLVLGGRTFRSRLFLGTGKYASFEQMAAALEASGTECVTVAVRRIPLGDRTNWQGQLAGPNLLDFIDRKKYALLPNTAGCYTAEDAIRTARLAREAGLSEFVKLEVLGDEKPLFPDVAATLEATRTLVKEGFTVLAYTNDDLITARRLEEAGAASVMPLGAPIGSGMGILNPHNIAMILDRLHVPVIVDAGVGTASDVAVAMELGAAGVLLNTGIALAKEPVRMARAMGLACEAGREAYLAGRMAPRPYAASPSSPTEGKIE